MHDRPRAFRQLMLVVAIPLLLQGCGRIGAMSRVDPLTIAVYPGGKKPSEPGNKDKASAKDEGGTTGAKPASCNLVKGAGGYFAGAIDLDCFRFPEDLADPDKPTIAGADEPAVINNARKQPAANGCTGPTGDRAYTRAVSCERDRNRLTALLLKQSDDVCVREMGSLTADQATVNATLDILSTAATTVANIVTGEQAKSILAGGGTLATASRSHINADVYRNTVSYAVSRAIIIERKRLRDLIEARYTQSVGIFTVDDAIRAANEYHGVCSFYRGLELVLASVEGDQRTRDAQMRREKVEDLERQVTRYRAMMSTPGEGEDVSIYAAKIKELVDQIQVLSLADIPAADQPAKAPETQGSGSTEKPKKVPKSKTKTKTNTSN